MSVMSMNSRMAMAEKLSIPQLQQAIQSGSLPAYIGVPLIEQKTREQSQMAAASQGQERPPSVTQQILQQAAQQQQRQTDPGIDQLPSNLPVAEEQAMGMAGGGIIAFAGEGPSLVPDPLDPRQEQPSEAPEESLSTQAEADRAYLKDMYNKFGAGIADVATIPFRALGSTGNLINRGLRATGLDVPNIPGKYTLDSGQSMTPFYDDIRKTAGETALPQPKAPSTEQPVAPPDGIQTLPAAPSTEQPVAPPDGIQTLPLFSSSLAGDDTASVSTQTVPPDGIQTLPLFSSSLAGDDTASVSTQTEPQPKPQTKPQPKKDTLSGQTRPSARNVQPSVSEMQAQMAGESAASPATSLIDKYTKMLEAQGEDSAQARKDAKGMAIFQAGLGIMGGTSPNAFANISQGALPAIQSYQQALQGLRKEDRDRVTKLLEAGLSEEKLAIELQKLGIEQQKADDIGAYYRGRVAAGLSEEKLAIELRKLGIEQQKADDIGAYYRGKVAAEASGDSNGIRTANAIRALDSSLSTNLSRVDTAIKNLATGNSMAAMYVQTPDEKIPTGQKKAVDAYRAKLADLEGQKTKWVNLHAARVRSLGGETLGDIEAGAGDGGSTLPPGLPPGSVAVGKADGKTVYKTPDGRQLIAE